METNTCNACGRTLALRPKNPNQNYCTNTEGHREHRWRWQQKKRRDDAEYRGHNPRASQAWTCTTDENGNSGAVARQRQQHLLGFNRWMQQAVQLFFCKSSQAIPLG